MLKLKTTSLLLISVFFSCELVNLEQLNCSTYPQQRESILAVTEPVWIEFSLPVVKSKAELLFKVLAPNGSRQGDLSWQEKRLIFTPTSHWDPGVRYVLSFNGEVETNDGRTFSISALVPFYAGTNDLPAILASTDPSNGEIIDNRHPLTFTFTKEMDTTISINDIFSLSPSTELIHEWQATGTQLVIRPLDRWAPLTLYTWTIHTEIKDINGIPLFKEYTGSFLVQNPLAPAPLIASLEPAIASWDLGFPPSGETLTRADNYKTDWIAYKDAIRINFEMPLEPAADDPARIDLYSLQKAFSMDPVARGIVQCVKTSTGADTFFVFVLNSGERFLNNTTYHIKISRELKNMEGVPLQEDFEGWFTADIRDIAINSMSVTNDDTLPDLVIPKEQFNSYIPFLIQLLPAESPENFIIDFNSEFTINDTDRYAIADKIVYTKIFPTSSEPYEKRNVMYESAECRLVVTFDGVPTERGAIFRLFIKGGPEGIVDSQGAYLESDIFIYIQIQEDT